MITPKPRPERLAVELTDDLEPTAGWRPVLNRTGIAYLRRGSSCLTAVEDWILPEYLEQAREVCSRLRITVGPTPSSTALRILRSLLTGPLGQAYSFSRQLRACGVGGGGRSEVGQYGVTEATADDPLWDVDFRAAYGTLLCLGPGDVCAVGVSLAAADYVDATVTDLGEYPISRETVYGRTVYRQCLGARRLFTATELACVTVVEVHQTYRLERRRDVATCGELLMRWRDELPVCKLLANSLVGRLAIESHRAYSAVSYPGAGDTYVAPGLYAREVEAAPRGAFATHAWIVGTCRGELTRLLSTVSRDGGRPITWDTDGAVVSRWSPPSTWGPFGLKRRSVSRCEVWGAKVSVVECADGEVLVRAGGLPGDPGPAEVRARCAPVLGQRLSYSERDAVQVRPDGRALGRRVDDAGRTHAYRARA